MSRAAWRLRHVCEACATPAQAMAAVHRAHKLAGAAARTTHRTDARIEALAARRAARTTDAPQEGRTA